MLRNNYRYFIIFMIILITIINYIDRGALSYAQAEIIKEFNLDPVSWGAILGYFGYGYIFGALFGGALADKKGPNSCGSLLEPHGLFLKSGQYSQVT